MARDGALVVDGVLHAYDWREENQRNDYANEFTQGTYERASEIYSADGWEMPKEKFFKRQTADDLAGVVFSESEVDFGVYHHVGLTEYYENGLSPIEPGIELKKRYPERTALFGFVDPLAENHLEHMEFQAEELGVDGFKLYPASYQDGDHLHVALNDPETGVPILNKAKELNVDHIAVHKSVPAGPAPVQFFDVDDIDIAAREYPDLTFQIVHGGFAFLEDTALLLANSDNVYATIESTSALVFHKPRQFARIMGELLYWAGPEKIIFATGCLLTHPQPSIDALWDFEFPQEMKDDYGYPDFTDRMKEQILGLNMLELLDVDPATLRREIEQNPIGEDRRGSEPWTKMIPSSEL